MGIVILANAGIHRNEENIMNLTKNQNLRRYLWPCAGLLVLLIINAIISPEFFQIEFKDGRFYGSLIDVLNRAAPVALLTESAFPNIVVCERVAPPSLPTAPTAEFVTVLNIETIVLVSNA